MNKTSIKPESGNTKIDEIVICSSNLGKLKEFKLTIFEILNFQSINPDLKISSITDYLPNNEQFDVNETGRTFIENSKLKSIAAARLLKGKYCLADDSGIEINALDGQPGIYSKRFLNDPQNGGLYGIAAMLEKLKHSKIQTGEKFNDNCRYVCALTLANPAGQIIFETENYWVGKISSKIKGNSGFGFDPMVHPYIDEINSIDMSRRVAELTELEKNTYSHRTRSLKKLLEYLT